MMMNGEANLISPPPSSCLVLFFLMNVVFFDALLKLMRTHPQEGDGELSNERDHKQLRWPSNTSGTKDGRPQTRVDIGKENKST